MTDGPLRILVTCDWFAPGTGGGAERVAYEVATRLAAAGHRIEILATQPMDHETFSLPAGVGLSSVPAVDLGRLLRVQASIAPAILTRTGSVLRSFAPDVVWAHSLQFQTTPVAAVWARRLRRPFVVTAHIGDLRALGGPLAFVARAHEATVGHAILRAATRAIAVSRPVAEHLRSIDRGVRVDVVPNGVDLARFRPGTPSGLPGLQVGFLGRLIANKGPDIAVRALATAVGYGVDARLRFAGDGPERTRLADLASTLGIADRVRFEGFRPDPETWLHGIDVLIRPSRTEGMPLGVLEAMAAGIPVIASDVPGNASLLDPGVGILVPVGDAGALGGALVRVARDPSLRERMRVAGLEAVAGCTWDRTAELTLRSLRRAIEDDTARRPMIPRAT